MKENLFENIVGQEQAKRKFNFYLDSYAATRNMPHTLIVAPKGQGKTTISRAIARGLVLFDADGKPVKKDDGSGKLRKKPLVEVNASTVKNVKQFINGLVIPFIQDKDVTVFCDEASELPRDVTMALLTILNPNPENRTTFSYDEYVCDFDFRRQTFIFATSEVQKVFHALVDRLERVDLEEYSLDDLSNIVKKSIQGVKFVEDVLTDVSSVLRGNARAAQKMANNIGMFLKGKAEFTQKDWKNMKQVLGIHPLGLTPLEINVLRYLRGSATGTSLTCMSAKTGMSKDSLQKDVELYLQKNGLMTIGTTGREITTKGIEYLNALDGIGRVIAGSPKKLKASAPVDKN